jgi:hypothetical protein
MQQSEPTVAQAVDFEGGFRAKLGAAVKEKLGALRGVGASVLEAAVDRVVDHAAELLDAPIAGLLTTAWARFPDVQALCDARKHPHDQDTMAELATHRFDWKHSPAIEVALNDLPAITIPLTLSVGITLTGGVLVVKGGKLRELRAGKGAADVTVSVADRKVVSRQAEVPFPRVLKLGEAAVAAPAVQVGKIASPEGELAGA